MGDVVAIGIEPRWIEVLREAARVRTQSAVARQLGVSSAMVNQVLKGVYKGNLARLQMLVEGALMEQTVACPVLGDLPSDRCEWYQRAPFHATNPVRVALYRACRSGCCHSTLTQEY